MSSVNIFATQDNWQDRQTLLITQILMLLIWEKMKKRWNTKENKEDKIRIMLCE